MPIICRWQKAEKALMEPVLQCRRQAKCNPEYNGSTAIHSPDFLSPASPPDVVRPFERFSLPSTVIAQFQSAQALVEAIGIQLSWIRAPLISHDTLDLICHRLPSSLLSAQTVRVIGIVSGLIELPQPVEVANP